MNRMVQMANPESRKCSSGVLLIYRVVLKTLCSGDWLLNRLSSVPNHKDYDRWMKREDSL
jgi:hypothetical protein